MRLLPYFYFVMEDIEKDINDAIMGRPYWFEVGEKRYALYPATLGKTLLMRGIVEALDLHIDKDFNLSPFTEVLRVVSEKRDVASRLVAIHSLKEGHEVMDPYIVQKRMDEFRMLEDEDLATLLMICLSKDNQISAFEKHLGMDRDRDRKRRVMSAKKTDNTFSFGGCSIYGSIIDVACQRYGWTVEYVVWGVSHTNLMMMLADQLTSVFLSDEERKNAHISNDTDVVLMSDASNNAKAVQALKMFK